MIRKLIDILLKVCIIYGKMFLMSSVENMKNKKVIITGITVGVIGYAVGNYLGIIVSQLLK